MRVGVVANLGKPRAAAVAGDLLDWLARQGVEPLPAPDVAHRLAWPGATADPRTMAEQVAFVVVLGGDGTLLTVAREVLPASPPLLGVNLGHLGFLTELELPELFVELPRFLGGGGVLDERRMLTGAVETASGAREPLAALNDVVVAKGPFSRLLRLRVRVGDDLLASYRGDGIILATPTGSTAYSLSAGGPVLDPAVAALVVTPVCPHTFDSRPTVVSGQACVGVEVEAEHADIMLTVDGQRGRAFSPSERLAVRLGPAVARLLRRPGWSFYEVLRRKIAEGERGDPEG